MFLICKHPGICGNCANQKFEIRNHKLYSDFRFLISDSLDFQDFQGFKDC